VSLIKIGEGVQLTIFEFFVEWSDKNGVKRVNTETSHESLLITDTRDAERQNEPYFTMFDLGRVEK
jgi:hypothetical protein